MNMLEYIHTRVPGEKDYTNARLRLESYRDVFFPVDDRIGELVCGGFYWLNYNDYSQCAYCGMIITGSRGLANPIKIHYLASEGVCEYIEMMVKDVVPSVNFNPDKWVLNQSGFTDEQIKKVEGFTMFVKYGSLMRQRENIEFSNPCCVCMTAERDTVLVKCKHLVMCEYCTANVTECPICRSEIVGSLKVYNC